LPKGATLAGKLWGSAEELKRTAKFIGDIGLAHLAKLPAVEDTETPNLAKWSYSCRNTLGIS
jgi:hypothetical protein